MTTNLDPTQEEALAVHQAICGIAAVCDGAQTKDNQGFDGADTKWGRGIAGVPFEAWTDDDIREGARLLNKYSRQGESVLGFDPRTLQIVQAEAESDTYYGSREHSRQVRRDAAARERGAAKIAQRKATINTDGTVTIGWVKGDPDFGAMLERTRALPNRRYDPATQTWRAPVSPELVDLIEEFDLAANFEPRAIAVTLANAEASKVHLTVENGLVVLHSTKAEAFRIIPSDRPYGGVSTKDAFKAYGFRWNGEVWSLPTTEANAELLEIANDAGFRCSDAVVALCKGAEEAQKDTESLQGLLALASRAKSLSELPEAFQGAVAEVLGR